MDKAAAARMLKEASRDVAQAKEVSRKVTDRLNGKDLLKKPMQTAVGKKFLSKGLRVDFDLYLVDKVPAYVSLSREIGRALRAAGFAPDNDAGSEAPTAGEYPKPFGKARVRFQWSRESERGPGGRLRLYVQWRPDRKDRALWDDVVQALGKDGLLKVVQEL